MKKKIIISIITLVVIVCAGVVGGTIYVKSLFTPVSPSQAEMIEVEIPSGSSNASIANILASNGLIKNTLAFKIYTRLNDTNNLIAGTYQMAPAMSMEEIIAVLEKGTVQERVEYKLLIPEGLQLAEISARIAKFTNGDAEEILQQLADENFIKEVTNNYPSEMTEGIFAEGTRYALEGYLYPATYSYYEEPSTIDLQTIIKPMLNETEKIYNQYIEQAKALGFDFHDLLTLSSIIEEEATAKVDRAKISSVFHNRLEIEMPLQTDPTVLYAMGEHKDRVLYKDLEIDSPYNTYRNNGLPIGPIANAGRSSIEAALNPEDTNYYYFLANKEGEVFFAEDFEEHKRLKAQHIN